MIVAVEYLNFIKCTFLMLFLIVTGLAHAMIAKIDLMRRRDAA